MKRATANTPRTCVPHPVQLQRLRGSKCAYCDVHLTHGEGGWHYCPCCERRFRRVTKVGWRVERITRIIGRCEHGA